MEVVIRQVYGLGNQLFQYAIGRYFSKTYGASLRIAVDLPQRMSSYGLPRPFLLPKFSIAAKFRQITTIERLYLSQARHFDVAMRHFRAVKRIQVIREPQPQPHVFDRSLALASWARLTYFIGLWQCYPPVQMMEKELRRELSFVGPARGKNAEVNRIIQGTPNAVSLHMRRGDFAIEVPDWVLRRDYYERALQVMRGRLSRPTFFVFSDDIPFAKDFAASHSDCILVDCNDSETAHEDLRLMSSCSHHIIANSTFSWWGAWLNPRADKMVIAPRRWVHYETERIEIALPGWTLL